MNQIECFYYLSRMICKNTLKNSYKNSKRHFNYRVDADETIFICKNNMSRFADFRNCHDMNTIDAKLYNFDGHRNISEENEGTHVDPQLLGIRITVENSYPNSKKLFNYSVDRDETLFICNNNVSRSADFWNSQDIKIINVKPYKFDGHTNIQEENKGTQVEPYLLGILNADEILSRALVEAKAVALFVRYSSSNNNHTTDVKFDCPCKTCNSNEDNKIHDENKKRTQESPRSKEAIIKLQKLSKDPTFDERTKQRLARGIINECPKVRHALEWMHRKYGSKDRGKRVAMNELEYVQNYEFIELLNLL